MIKIATGGSKSISNRLLIIYKLYDNCINISNLSNSNDTKVLQSALNDESADKDIHHAGTSMRFLTSLLSIQENKHFSLTGSERMKQRPIGVLVKALQKLGADIKYIEKDEFPPLKIYGKKLLGGTIEIEGNISSQFITSLLLIGSKLKNGLTINVKGKLVSLPYVQMTLDIQNALGIKSTINDSQIKVPFTPKIQPQNFIVESDWSSASYFYSVVATQRKQSIFLKDLFSISTQADAKIASIYSEYFGVKTTFINEGIELSAIANFEFEKSIILDCNTFPDIAQTIIVTAFALQIPCKLTGLETLKIKETDRIIALQTELAKFGGKCVVSPNSIQLFAFEKADKNICLKTYKDHRMAMAFAPLLLQKPFAIEDKNVVEKSYPTFWIDFDKVLD